MSAERPASTTSPTSSLPPLQFQYRGHDILDLLKDARNYNRWLADQVLVAKPGHSTRTVDLGAGRGTFSDLVRARGLNVECVEPDADNRRELHRLGFIVRGALQEFDSESLDYIFSLNVLEHVDEDEALVAAAFSRLRHGGRFFVFVPAFPILWSRLDDHVEHARR